MRYLFGTIVQHRNGYVFVKTENGIIAQHRWVAMQKIVHRPLKEGEVVIRRIPKRDYNAPENLVVIQHSLTKFKMLPKSRVIYVPKMQLKSLAIKGA